MRYRSFRSSVIMSCGIAAMLLCTTGCSAPSTQKNEGFSSYMMEDTIDRYEQVHTASAVPSVSP